MAVFIVGLAGCGEPLVDGEYPGEAILQVVSSVEIIELEEIADAEGDLRVAMFWRSEPSADQRVTEIPEQQVLISKLPGYYGFNLYATPPEEVMVDGFGGRYAVGSLMLYVDDDEDGSFEPGEDWLVGGVANRVYLFSRERLSIPEIGDVEPGYHGVTVERDEDSGSTLCEDGELPPLPGNVDVPLIVDLLDRVIIDTDCDQRAEEWGICPPPDHVMEECAPDFETERCWPWRHCD